MVAMALNTAQPPHIVRRQVTSAVPNHRLPDRRRQLNVSFIDSRSPVPVGSSASHSNGELNHLERAKTKPAADIHSAAAVGDATVLYVDFPDVVQRWEVDEERTKELVKQAHGLFASVAAAHGGTANSAHL